MLVGLGGICVGTYAVLDRTAPRLLALPMLALGVVAAVVGLLSAGRRVERSRYRPDPWRWPEVAVSGSGVLTGLLGWWVAHHELPLAFPDLSTFPSMSAVSLLGAAVALAGGLCAPPPTTAYVVAPPLPQEVAA
jgi:energy-coupling factor transport system permease protein